LEGKSLGDVGSTAEDAKKRLEEYFAQGSRWGCILLINDADVFLSARQRGGNYSEMDGLVTGILPLGLIASNRLAKSNSLTYLAVISYLLGTFSGVLFLTTNRIGSFDEAVMSRVHIILYYPPLNLPTTLEIFKVNMKRILKLFKTRAARVEFDEDRILEFARSYYERQESSRWNGRQIHNALDTALALAEAEALEKESIVRLKVEHVERVAKVQLEFSEYLYHVRGADEGRRAIDFGFRADKPYKASKKDVRLDDFDPTAGEDIAIRAKSRMEPKPPASHHPTSHLNAAQLELQTPQVLNQLFVQGQFAGQEQPVHPDPFIPTTLQLPSSFVLASPLSSEAKPELNFTAKWEIFKKARTSRDKDCNAIDVLDGEPVLSFDMNALESIWWSGWADRLGKGDDKARERETSDILRKRELTPGLVPLPERIRIHSKHIMSILKQIHGKAINDNAVVMVRPFRALVYYKEQILQKYEGLSSKFEGRDAVAADESPAAKEGGKNDVGTESFQSFRYLKCLVEFIDKTIEAKMRYLSSNDCHRVAFADIWYLFKPGDEVIGQDRRQAYRVLSITSTGHKFIPPWKTWRSKRAPALSESSVTLHCVHVDFDGQKLGPVSTKISIFKFDGEKDVTSLPVFPLRFAKDPNAGESPKQSFRERLIARGEMFVDVIGMKPMHYNGPTLDPRDEVDSQVVIDFEEAFSSKENEYEPPALEQLIGTPIGESKDEEPCSAACCADEEVHQDGYAETKRNQHYISTLNRGPEHLPSVAIDTRDLVDTKSGDNRLSHEELVIMSYRVYGFVLRNRKWGKLQYLYATPLPIFRSYQLLPLAWNAS